MTATYAVREVGDGPWWQITDTISGQGATHDFGSFLAASSTYTLNVYYTTPTVFNPAETFEVSITWWAASHVAIDASATEVFLLTMKDTCIDNAITCDMLAVDFTHTILADTGTVAATSVASTGCTQAVGGVDSSPICSFVSTLEIWTESTDSWDTYTTGATATWPWIRTSDFATTNSARMVTADSTDFMSYLEPITYAMRWKAVDDTSFNPQNVTYDYFDITIKYECFDDVLSLTGPTDIPFQEYQIGQGSTNFPANIA